MLVVVHIADGLTVSAGIHPGVGPRPEIGGGLLQIGLAEGVHRAVEQGQHRRRVLQLILAAGGGKPHLRLIEVALRQFDEDVIGLVVLLLRIEDVTLHLPIAGQGIDADGFLDLGQCLVERPTLVGLVALIEVLVVDHPGKGEVGIVLVLGEFDGLLHIALRCGKVAVARHELCPIGVAVGGRGELADEILYETDVGGGVGTGAGHKHHQVGILDVVGQFHLDLRLAQRRVVHAESADLQRVGKTGTDGITQRVLGRGGGLHNAYHLATLVEQRTTDVLFRSLHRDGVVGVVRLEGLGLADSPALHILRLAIG